MISRVKTQFSVSFGCDGLCLHQFNFFPAKKIELERESYRKTHAENWDFCLSSSRIYCVQCISRTSKVSLASVPGSILLLL